MLRNIGFGSPLGHKAKIKNLKAIAFKTFYSPSVVPKLTTAERIFIFEKYFETKSVAKVLSPFK